MDKPIIKERRSPEAKIEKDVIRYLRMRQWFVQSTHGNMYQRGFPDLFAANRRYGSRWIEIKNPASYRFTTAQLNCFPRMANAGIGIWILTTANDDEYIKLFRYPNWWVYLKFNGLPAKVKTTKFKESRGPEREIQDAIIKRLENDGWFVNETHGNLYQRGFPDLYACKKGCGSRWIEVKNPASYKFTPAQLETFHRMTAEGVPIWILTSDSEINKLCEPANWLEYLK